MNGPPPGGALMELDGSLAFMPVSNTLLHQPNQPAGAQALAAEGLPFLHGLQAPGLPDTGLDGLPPLDGVLDPLPPLPAVSASGGAAAAAASSAPRASGAIKPASARRADKQAIAREKNRLAQQRFREKERQKIAEVEAEAEALRRQLSQLRIENERLQLEQTLLEKLLVVRDAILSVAVQLDAQAQQAQQQQQLVAPAGAQQAQQGRSVEAAGGGDAATASATLAGCLSAVDLLQDPAALQAASQQLAVALGELPSMDQVERMVGQLGDSSGDGSNASCGAASRGGGGIAGASGGAPTALGAGAPAAAAAANGGAPAPDLPSTAAGSPSGLPPISATAEAAVASGLAVEKSRLREVAPSPCPNALKAVESIDHVECLLEDWRQWRQELRELFQEAQARQFAEREHVDALSAQMRKFVEIFWAACHTRPQLFNLFLARSLPPPGADASAEWARIAQESLPLLSDADVAIYRRAMHRYTKRVAVAAVGVRPWVLRLQAVVAAQRDSVGSMHRMAAQHAQVREAASRLHYACTEHYLAYMGLLAEISAHSSVVLRALWHSSSDPYAPDHPAIVSQVLRMHQQRPQQQLAQQLAQQQAQQVQQAQQQAQQQLAA